MTTPVRFLRWKPAGLLLFLSVVAHGCGNGRVEAAGPGGSASLEIVPGLASLAPGGAETFVALAQGAIASGVDWQTSAGSITSAGLFTAPTEAGTYQIQARYAGATGSATAIVSTPGSPASFYAAAVSSCGGMPLRSTGTIRYFCDCAAGAQAGCVAGDDANPGTSPAAPRRSWAAARAAFNSMAAGETVALCRGGAWIAPTGQCTNQFSNARCAAGASLTDPANTSTCDLRDYQASWGGTAKPLIQLGAGTGVIISQYGANTNGVRILNLAFRGSNAGPNGGVYDNQEAIYTSNGCSLPATNLSHWLVCNNTFSHFRIGMQGPQNGSVSSFSIRGNLFDMNDLDAILGMGNGSSNTIDANVFDNTGGFRHPVTGNQAHYVYISPASTTGWGVGTATAITNNQFLRTAAGSAAPGVCATPILVSHGQFQTMNIENNYIDGGAGMTVGCYGISFNAAGSDNTYYRNFTLRRNTINAATGIVVGQAPGVIIENNVIRATAVDGWMMGIWTPYELARAGQDDVQTTSTIRNNTVYMTGSSANKIGIVNGYEGTNHVIANNAVYMTSGSCWRTMLGHCSATTAQACTADPGLLGRALIPCPGGETCIEDGTAYSFVGGNACYGGASHTDHTPESTPAVTSNPLFTTPPTNFTPATDISPLIGAGSAAHAPPMDALVRPRPSPPSIGAFEP